MKLRQPPCSHCSLSPPCETALCHPPAQCRRHLNTSAAQAFRPGAWPPLSIRSLRCMPKMELTPAAPEIDIDDGLQNSSVSAAQGSTAGFGPVVSEIEHDMAALLHEIRETNRLLQLIVAKKAPSVFNDHRQSDGIPAAKSSHASHRETRDSGPLLGSDAGLSPAPENTESLEENVHRLTDETIRSVLWMQTSKAVALRNAFFSYLDPMQSIQAYIQFANRYPSSNTPDANVPLVFGTTARGRTLPHGVVWTGVPRFPTTEDAIVEFESEGPLRTDIRSVLEDTWPLNWERGWEVQGFFATPSRGPPRFATPGSTAAPGAPPDLRWLDQLNFMCSALCFDSEGRLFPALAALDGVSRRTRGRSSTKLARWASLW
ncbi:hypothetical protein B0T16DRAFT_102558 [Cercophora newfieldiana]|uniref:Uncharacterized protein n=1 Tax=Cercophora newfieldiana TaxID=92897 RepID=A0AA39YH88_9PEZI|nr:hypothetical protein B0T16DRAFT_102558 [Cercophora newfieldiana]